MASTILVCLIIGAIGAAMYFGPKGPMRESAILRFFGALTMSVAILFTVTLFASFTTAMIVALIALFIGTATLLGVKSWLWKIIFFIILVVLFFTIGGLLDYYPESSFPNKVVSTFAEGVKSIVQTIGSETVK